MLGALPGSTARELARMVPELEHRLAGGPAPRVLDAETERYLLFEAVAEVLCMVSALVPLVLVLDDLHWSDKPSLLLLRHLARSPRITRLMILGTYRETDLARRHPLSEALIDMRRDQRYERVLLRGLSSAEVRQFMEATAGHAFSGRGLTVPEAIHRETEGNPFFIGEVVRHMVETGRFFQRDGIWVLDTAAGDLGIPEGVRDVITRRLARLPDGCNQVLAQASVLGREFEFDVVSSMVGSYEETLAAIEETLERSLVVEVAERKLPTYAFTHSLVRQSLYEEISLPRKQKLHLRAAEAIERTHQRDMRPYVAALAVHYRYAGAAADAGKAIDYSIQAGRAAYASAAYEEAVIHLEAALQLIEEEDTLRERHAEVLELLGDLMYITGIDRAQGVTYLEGALEGYQREARVDRAVLVQSKLGRSYSTFPETMDIPAAREQFHAALSLVSELPVSVPIGYLHVGIAAAELWGMRIPEGMDAAERALAIAEATGNKTLWASAASLKGFFLAESGRPAHGLDLLDAAWQAADEANHISTTFFAAWTGSGIPQFVHDNAAAVARLRRELDSERSRQNSYRRALLTGALISMLTQCGDIEAARGLEPDVPPGHVSGSYFITRFWLAYAAGDWERAASSASWGEQDTAARGDNMLRWMALALLGWARIAEGDASGAGSALEQGFSLCQRAGSVQGMSWIGPALARICLDAGEIGRAQEVIDTVRSAHQSLETAGALGARLAEVEAEIALRQGDEKRAEKLFAESIAAYVPFPEPFLEAEFRYRWAHQLNARGDRAGADTQLEVARQIYTRIGAGPPWIDRLERAHGAAERQAR
jgi:tetratricopeptide (TPR) repeat protein